MRIDFHTHGKWTKQTEFSLPYFEEMIENARDAGLNATALTEHFNTHHFYDVMQTLDAKYPYIGDHYDVDGFKIFTGIEIDVKEGGHILFIGPRTSIQDIRSKLDDYTEKNHFIPFSELMKLAKGHPLLKIGAHPLRDSNPLTELNLEQLSQLDAFDLNGRDLFRQGFEQTQINVAKFAENVGKPVVCGSDTHLPIQFGAVFNDFDQDCQTALELKAAIKERAYRVGISPVLKTRVGAADMLKEVWKKNKDNHSLTSV
ncbi:PHP-associated domain-containing protein [Alkalicoccobacillus porphyridii]|uniref:PHP domain-containing protein n=1 Tax=Alkalicoccobacillus porphyridii TaxID=2597270 RepID=A0A554A143_9BACI|nr:PHP-associated domain-containing protein [Alkalicoccobacillus porphyridii]TSB47411.1 PHP domain-containing protein [Alkalicoccobacillus porphyridii]